MEDKRARWQQILSNIYEKSNTNFKQTVSENTGEENSFQFILWSDHNSDTKIWQRHCNKRILQTNICHEYWQKNLLNSINKLNLAAFKKNTSPPVLYTPEMKDLFNLFNQLI